MVDQHALRHQKAMRAFPSRNSARSNVGRMKTIYRHGLGVRYGRIMQAISGVHFNYSFSPTLWDALEHINQSDQPRQDFVSEQYFGVLRNYRRFGWLVLYLFGTSPAVSKSFFAGREIELPSLDEDTVYEPYGTSLRMSDIGYRNKTQATVSVSVNGLDEYVRDLSKAISTPYPPYERIGVKVNGEYLQLNANILQIENEYYSFIRPKRIARSGERPTKALRRAGVEYVEVRALDVSAFDPVGVNQNKLRFLEAFLALCLLRDSEPIDRGEQEALDENHLRVARRGREPGLKLNREGRRISDVGMGARAARFDAGRVRVAGPRGAGATVCGGARTAARQDRRGGAHPFGTPAHRDAPDRGIFLSARAAHVEDAQGLLSRSLSAERAPLGGVRRRGAGVARGAAPDRGGRPRGFRHVSRPLPCGLRSGRDVTRFAPQAA